MARVQSGVPWTSGTDDQTTEVAARNTAAEDEATSDDEIAALLDGAPAALDTLNELAAALADDADFAGTVTSALAAKAPLASPTFTGTVTLPDDTVSNAKAANMAQATVKGRAAGAGTGDPTDLTGAQAAAVLAGEVFKQAQEVNAQTGTTYTLVAGDAGKLVTLSNASAITLTVPQDSDATIAVGTYVDLMQLGAGQVTVAAGTGATLQKSGLTAKARAQYSRLGVQKISANTWSLFGDLAAS